MKLRLFDGRRDPREAMTGRGFEGPTIRGVAWVNPTYRATFAVGFHRAEDMRLAAHQTGWKAWDATALEITITGDMIEAAGCFYGDFELVEESNGTNT